MLFMVLTSLAVYLLKRNQKKIKKNPPKTKTTSFLVFQKSATLNQHNVVVDLEFGFFFFFFSVFCFEIPFFYHYDPRFTAML